MSARTPLTTEQIDDHRKTVAAAEARARLREAAPDLLAALIALRAVAFHSTTCPTFPPGCAMEPCVCGYDDAEEAARAAVKKATTRDEAASPAARAAIAKFAKRRAR